jgi:hypothetical protein
MSLGYQCQHFTPAVISFKKQKKQQACSQATAAAAMLASSHHRHSSKQFIQETIHTSLTKEERFNTSQIELIHRSHRMVQHITNQLIHK